MTDWADDLAQQIAADLGAYDLDNSTDDAGTKLVAARLRMVRLDGKAEGLETARVAVAEVFDAHKVQHAAPPAS